MALIKNTKNNSFKIFKNKVLELLNKKNDTYSKLLEENFNLRQKYDVLTKRVFEIESVKLDKKTCINCKEKFLPIFNYDTSCCYHSKSLAYYSCR